ncbi:N-terminal domain of NEFA-interacting nuclear protein NIP30-domain-containing protein [Morchella snyderi]|nr:N-terminal domain of NEFA-interacting nuclear protein NIP30-domain-containing protein [Morchella snyderi]
MSSGFVSAGTSNLDETTAESAAAPALSSDAWAAAKAKVEEAHRPREEEPQEERSLFAILQANKAKKQEEFEEKLKFKNQFKPLDEDDVEYLDSILCGERRAEEARKQELEAQLDAFRQQQSEIEQTGAAPEVEGTAELTSWGTTGRKRRKKEEGGKGGKLGLGVKVRKTSVTTAAKVEKKESPKEDEKPGTKEATQEELKQAKPASPPVNKEVPLTEPKQVAKPPVVGGLMGLVAYDSDEDDD